MTLTTPAPLVPISPPADGVCLQCINANLEQVADRIDVIRADIPPVLNSMREEMREEMHLMKIQIANSFAAASPRNAPLRYPHPFVAVAGGALPRTPEEARNLSDEACAAALDALSLNGAPGLQPLPANPTAAMRKKHLLDYLGIDIRLY